LPMRARADGKCRTNAGVFLVSVHNSDNMIGAPLAIDHSVDKIRDNVFI